MKLPRPPLVEERLLAVVDGEWRTAKEIYAMFDQGSPVTARSALARLAEDGKVLRRFDPHPSGMIARYRCAIETRAGRPPVFPD